MHQRAQTDSKCGFRRNPATLAHQKIRRPLHVGAFPAGLRYGYNLDMNVIDDLERCFPGYRSPDRASAWKAGKSRVPDGSRVTGVVVAKYPFGVFVDIGLGFPALLEIICIDGLTPKRYREGNWCPLGS